MVDSLPGGSCLSEQSDFRALSRVIALPKRQSCEFQIQLGPKGGIATGVPIFWASPQEINTTTDGNVLYEYNYLINLAPFDLTLDTSLYVAYWAVTVP